MKTRSSLMNIMTTNPRQKVEYLINYNKKKDTITDLWQFDISFVELILCTMVECFSKWKAHNEESYYHNQLTVRSVASKPISNGKTIILLFALLIETSIREQILVYDEFNSKLKTKFNNE